MENPNQSTTLFLPVHNPDKLTHHCLKTIVGSLSLNTQEEFANIAIACGNLWVVHSFGEFVLINGESREEVFKKMAKCDEFRKCFFVGGRIDTSGGGADLECMVCNEEQPTHIHTSLSNDQWLVLIKSLWGGGEGETYCVERVKYLPI